MLTITLKGLAANKARFTLTAFAVILAVSFVSSAFVLGDGLRSSFDDLAVGTAGRADLQVRSPETFGSPALLDPALADRVAGLDGVAAAAPSLSDAYTTYPLSPSGEEVRGAVIPPVVSNWTTDGSLNPFTVVDGEAPTGPGQFALDAVTAADHGFAVGGTYPLMTPTGRVEAVLTATTTVVDGAATTGGIELQVETGWLVDLLDADGYDAVLVRLADGADRRSVEAELTRLAPGAEVVDRDTLVTEARDDASEGIGVLTNVILGFAGISVFVSIFIIANTFSIVLGQRTRELALLRAIGAEPSQLRRSVLGEAVVIGFASSIVGVGAGVGLARGLLALFDATGAGLPDSPVVVAPRTVAVALGVGVVTTLVSSIGPARRASRVPPMAALRDGIGLGRPRSRARLVVGALLVASGVGALALGLFAAEGTGPVVSLLALGAAGTFVGITLGSPLLVGPVTAVLAAPLRLGGTAGGLASRNAARNPHRTATTAAALMIGLALVSMVLVVGESVKAQLRETLGSSVDADYLSAGGPFPASLRQELDDLPVTGRLVSFRWEEMEVDGEVGYVDATDLAVATDLFDLDIVAGDGSDLAVTDPVLVAERVAEERNLAVGDTVTVTTGAGVTATLTVIGVFADEVIVEDPYLVDLTTWDRLGGDPGDGFLAFDLAPGVTTAEAEAAFAPLEAAYPQLDLLSSAGYVDWAGDQIDEALAVVNVLVALAVLIALVGIANTLALSVLERTRELGLLRAVGMSRRQLRRMVRLEAGLVALFGATLGVAVGTAFGWAAVEALPEGLTSTLDVPFDRIGTLVVVAALAGLVAAWGPARRAGRLRVLDAIAH